MTKNFHRALHRWYAAHGRDHLPWRATRDPYAIYISEIMLQQTQVQTVLDRFYHPFLTRFPTLQSLASAQQQDVLHAWQGLGYYSRAVNLHRTAQAAGKNLPQTIEALMALPGIGRNTAHAVAAFAFGAAVPVMEANVRRLLHRIFALPKASEEALWQHAVALLDPAKPYDYNQAMMDLGAMICTPRRPQCGECPAHSICKGKTAPEFYPAPKQRKATPVRKRRILLCFDSKGRLYAAPRTTRFLHGLYSFAETSGRSFSIGNLSLPLARAQKIGGIRQAYSHFTLEAEIYRLTLPKPMNSPHWHTQSALRALPVSAAERAILALLKPPKPAKSRLLKR